MEIQELKGNWPILVFSNQTVFSWQALNSDMKLIEQYNPTKQAYKRNT